MARPPRKPTPPPDPGELEPELDGDQEQELEQELERPRAAQPAPPIRRGERFLACGFTGTGKSELALNTFASYPGQRLYIDNQDHYALGPDALAEDPPPLDGITDPADIDWRHRTIRYVPSRPGDTREMDRLYAACFRRGNMLIVADELEDVAPAHGCPFWVRKGIKQGRKESLTHGATTQRPVGIEPAARNQANHLLVFPLVDTADVRVIAPRLGMTVDQLHEELNALERYAYLHQPLGELDENRRPVVLRMPPLPPETIAYTRRHIVNPEFR